MPSERPDQVGWLPREVWAKAPFVFFEEWLITVDELETGARCARRGWRAPARASGGRAIGPLGQMGISGHAITARSDHGAADDLTKLVGRALLGVARSANAHILQFRCTTLRHGATTESGLNVRTPGNDQCQGRAKPNGTIHASRRARIDFLWPQVPIAHSASPTFRHALSYLPARLVHHSHIPTSDASE